MPGRGPRHFGPREMIHGKHASVLIEQARILVVDDNPFMRGIVRNLLANVGVKAVHEAADGIEALEQIRSVLPHIVILDWEMPLLNGAEVVRIVRSPGVFPMPDIPIIMLTGHGERWRIIEAAKLGVNEFLCKPVSAKSLLDRMVSILTNPRPSVKLGEYYGPAPRGLLDRQVPTEDESDIFAVASPGSVPAA
jgi:two-component system chemotaxis response regulator CheY